MSHSFLLPGHVGCECPNPAFQTCLRAVDATSFLRGDQTRAPSSASSSAQMASLVTSSAVVVPIVCVPRLESLRNSGCTWTTQSAVESNRPLVMLLQDYLGNGCMIYVIQLSQLSQCEVACSILTSYGVCFFVAELSSRVTLSSAGTVTFVALLNVIVISTFREMSRITAWWIIARMQTHWLRPTAMCEPESYTMSKLQLLLKAKLSVSSVLSSGCPVPTLIW